MLLLTNRQIEQLADEEALLVRVNLSDYQWPTTEYRQELPDGAAHAACCSMRFST